MSDNKPSDEFLAIAEPIAHAQRLDANETTILARSLEASAVRAVEHVYPGLKARRLVPMLEGISPGADTFTWHEMEKTGEAKIITNYADDLPSVGQFLTENTGKIRSLGNSFEYSTQDLRRVAQSGSKGLHPTLDPRPMAIADEFIERKIDELAAVGDATFGLPGVLNNSSVTIQAATGNWNAGGATAVQIVEDLRAAIDAIAVDSDGNYMATHIAMPIAQLRYLMSTPLLGAGDNRLTIMQELMGNERAAGNVSFGVTDWFRCAGAGAGGVDRCMVYQQTSDVLGLINPMRAMFHPPQMKGLHWSVPVEARAGGALILKPLAVRYIDGI